MRRPHRCYQHTWQEAIRALAHHKREKSDPSVKRTRVREESGQSESTQKKYIDGTTFSQSQQKDQRMS